VFSLLIVVVVVAVPALYVADRIIKAQARARRLAAMSERLTAATQRAEQQHERKQEVARASAELTSVMPAITRPPLSLPDEPEADEESGQDTT
jgi:type II secretory pathway pseudopilin PulG